MHDNPLGIHIDHYIDSTPVRNGPHYDAYYWVIYRGADGDVYDQLLGVMEHPVHGISSANAYHVLREMGVKEILMVD